MDLVLDLTFIFWVGWFFWDGGGGGHYLTTCVGTWNSILSALHIFHVTLFGPRINE